MKLKPSVVFTRNEKSNPDWDQFYSTADDHHADTTCPELTRILFEVDEEGRRAFTDEEGTGFAVGTGRAATKLHIIDDFNKHGVCGYTLHGHPNGECSPVVKYDKKYNVCIKCRRYFEQQQGGE